MVRNKLGSKLGLMLVICVELRDDKVVGVILRKTEALYLVDESTVSLNDSVLAGVLVNGGVVLYLEMKVESVCGES